MLLYERGAGLTQSHDFQEVGVNINDPNPSNTTLEFLKITLNYPKRSINPKPAVVGCTDSPQFMEPGVEPDVPLLSKAVITSDIPDFLTFFVFAMVLKQINCSY